MTNIDRFHKFNEHRLKKHEGREGHEVEFTRYITMLRVLHGEKSTLVKCKRIRIRLSFMDNRIIIFCL